MRSLLQLLALCAAFALCVCNDSHESSESTEDLFVPRNRANSFIIPRRGYTYGPPRAASFNRYNFMRMMKSPVERRAETCEDFSPCRFYAYHHGYQQAYQRYFGSRNQLRRPAVRRRH